MSRLAQLSSLAVAGGITVGVALAGCAGDPLPGGGHAEECGQCHVPEYDAWSNSRLAAGTEGDRTSPVFNALLPHVEEAWGKVARARCVSCHQPGFGGDHGVGCVACHSAVGNRGVQNGAVVVDLGAPIGARRAVDARPAHETVAREYLTSSEMCGTCHVVHGPGLFEEVTLDELLDSAPPVRACVDCHMPKTKSGGADHRFTGVDPLWGAPAEEREAGVAASTALLAQALTLEVTTSGEGFEVRLTNTGGGHAVPTGVSFVRDLWVDVRLLDSEGAVLDMPRVIELGGRLSRDGQPVSVPTEADAIEPLVLASGESAKVPVAIPPGAVSPITLEATLRARAVRAELLEALGLKDREEEVPEMVVAVVTGATSQAP